MKMNDNQITRQSNIESILGRWPQTVSVFLRYKLACIGCTMAPFETLADVLSNYSLSEDQFLADIQKSISDGVSEQD